LFWLWVLTVAVTLLLRSFRRPSTSLTR
jgi:hypothetical protein